MLQRYKKIYVFANLGLKSIRSFKSSTGERHNALHPYYTENEKKLYLLCIFFHFFTTLLHTTPSLSATLALPLRKGYRVLENLLFWLIVYNYLQFW